MGIIWFPLFHRLYTISVDVPTKITVSLYWLFGINYYLGSTVAKEVLVQAFEIRLIWSSKITKISAGWSKVMSWSSIGCQWMTTFWQIECSHFVACCISLQRSPGHFCIMCVVACENKYANLSMNRLNISSKFTICTIAPFSIQVFYNHFALRMQILGVCC